MCRFGLTEGVLIDAEETNWNFKGVKFSCVQCGEAMVYRAGKQIKHHFSHLPGSTCTVSKKSSLLSSFLSSPLTNLDEREKKGETYLHKCAKLILTERIKEKSISFSAPVWCTHCKKFVRSHDFDTREAIFTDVKQEYRVRGGDRTEIPDIAILNGNEILFFVEIKVSHAIESRSYPWIEVDVGDEDKLANLRACERLEVPIHTSCFDCTRKHAEERKERKEREERELRNRRDREEREQSIARKIEVEQEEEKESIQKFTFGKYQGMTYDDVFTLNRGYIDYVLAFDSPPSGIFSFLKNKAPYAVFPLGKYRGKKLREINDKGYMTWMSECCQGLPLSFTTMLKLYLTCR